MTETISPENVGADSGPIHLRRATLRPQSVNLAERNVEVIWSTGAPVRRRDMGAPMSSA